MKNKSNIIIIVLGIILLIMGIVVNVIAYTEKTNDISTKNAKNVENNNENLVANETEEKIEEEEKEEEEENQNWIEYVDEVEENLPDELQLTGEKFVPANVLDKDEKVITIDLTENIPIVLDFINSEEVSKITAQMLQNLYGKYKDKVRFYLVAENEEKENIISVLEETGIEIPIVFDSEMGSLSKANNVNSIPSIYMIDKKGEIINMLIPEIAEITEDSIEANLDILIENY